MLFQVPSGQQCYLPLGVICIRTYNIVTIGLRTCNIVTIGLRTCNIVTLGFRTCNIRTYKKHLILRNFHFEKIIESDFLDKILFFEISKDFPPRFLSHIQEISKKILELNFVEFVNILGSSLTFSEGF